jgi:predicted dehydrogenase
MAAMKAMSDQSSGRRDFLSTAAATALTTNLFTGNVKGANDKVNVGYIGVGTMGTGNINSASKVSDVKIVALCDVYQPNLEKAQAAARKAGFEDVKLKKDFREIIADKSIDAVCISTPDHWHAYMTVEACKAGKDVYVEKPACVYVEEGIKMVEAARKYNRVVQGGTMQRSGGFFKKAVSIVKSGDLGDVSFCRTHRAGLSPKEGYGNPPDAEPPAGLDWDLWLGPAAKRPFNINRFGIVPGRWSTFRYFWDYAGGDLTDWGPHLIDIVQMAFDEVMPTSISAQGGKFYMTDNLETPDTIYVAYKYPKFASSFESRSGSPTPLYGAGSGTAFHGSKATLMVNRSGYTIYPNEKGATPIEEKSRELAAMQPQHWQNFIDCIRSRQRPASDIENCVRTTISCLLGNLSLRHGVTLDWDDKAMTVKQQNIRQYLKAKYRSPWKLEV